MVKYVKIDNKIETNKEQLTLLDVEMSNVPDENLL